MPNPYHFRAKIDRLWRQANSNIPGYRQLDALDAIARELHAPTERARQNQQMYSATDPYDVARHLLRDLYDRADPSAPEDLPVPASEAPPGSDQGRGPAPSEQPTEEDDDPL